MLIIKPPNNRYYFFKCGHFYAVLGWKECCRMQNIGYGRDWMICQDLWGCVPDYKINDGTEDCRDGSDKGVSLKEFWICNGDPISNSEACKGICMEGRKPCPKRDKEACIPGLATNLFFFLFTFFCKYYRGIH